MIEYNTEIKNFNGTDTNTLYPITKIENVQGLQEELDNKTSLEVYEITVEKYDWHEIPIISNVFYNRVFISDISWDTPIFTESRNNKNHSYLINNNYTYSIGDGYIEFRTYNKPTQDIILTVFCYKR